MCGPKPGLKVIYNTVAPPQTEQEVLTLSENRSLLKFFSGCSLYSIFSFLVAFCRSLYVFVFFLFTIILSVHQFTAFEHPFLVPSSCFGNNIRLEKSLQYGQQYRPSCIFNRPKCIHLEKEDRPIIMHIQPNVFWSLLHIGPK